MTIREQLHNEHGGIFMGAILKKKLTCLLVVIVFTFTTIVGCGGAAEDLKEILTDNNLTMPSDEETTAGGDATNNQTSDNDETDGDAESVSGDTQSESDSSDNSGSSDNSTTSSSTDESTTISPSSESKPGETKPDESKSSSETETTSKKPETNTTKKPEETTPKPTQQETTTPKPTTSSGNSQSGSSSSTNLSTAEKMAKAIVDSIITSGMSEFDKAIAIHDWLTYNLDYDFTYSHYYVEETLRDRTCVCQGYALTFKMMCEMAGLQVGYVTGTGTNSAGQTESHAWNQVRIDGQWYNVDVTWDDPASPGKDFNDHSANRYEYFLISDAHIEKNHTTNVSRQTCPSDYDTRAILKYAANSGINPTVAYAENATDFAKAVAKFYEAGKTDMILWYYDTTVTSDNMWNVLWGLLPAAPVAVSYNPSYPPENGVTKYILTLPSKAEWSSIPLVTSKEALADLINTNYAAGTTTFDVRFEPANGVIEFAPSQYAFSYYSLYYNNNKSVLLSIVPPA